MPDKLFVKEGIPPYCTEYQSEILFGDLCRNLYQVIQREKKYAFDYAASLNK